VRGVNIGVVHPRVYTKHLDLGKNIFRDNNIIWNRDDKFNRPWLETLETNVVDFCNLNCKGCSHFSNIFPRNYKIPYESFERDVKQIAGNVFIEQFNLLGGEVFLCDNLADYIECIAGNMPETKIELISNGLLIPQVKEDLWNIIQKYDVAVSISGYAPSLKMRDKIAKILEEKGIHYNFRPNVESFGKNIDLSGKNNPWVSQTKCRESKCQFLRNGKIYKCPFSALGNYYFDHYSINIHFEEGFDIYDANADWKAFTKNVRKHPIEQCRYCGEEKRFAWGISNKPKKEEWLI